MNAIMNRSLLFALLAAAFAMGTPALGAENAEGESEEAHEPAPATIEIGRFMIRDLRVTEGTKLRLSFVLYAEVDSEHEEQARKIAVSHEHRMRNEVLTAIRTAQQGDFHEPGLERFRRRIFLRLRRGAPYLIVQRLLIGEFELMID